MSLRKPSVLAMLAACLLPSLSLAATWQELVAECEQLLPPMLPVEQAQALLPQAQIASEVKVSAYADSCWLNFEPSEDATFRPRGITPLLLFAISKGEAEVSSRKLKSMYRDTPEFRFRALDAASWPGATAVYAHQSMGRHWLVIELGDRGLSVQISDDLPEAQLEPIARHLLSALERPEIEAWMQR